MGSQPREPGRRNSVGWSSASTGLAFDATGTHDVHADADATDDNDGSRALASLQRFITWMERQNRSPKTIANYARRIADLEDWLGDHGRPLLRKAAWRDVRAYANDRLPFTYASRQGLRSAIRSYWAFLGRDAAPTWAVESPKKKRGQYKGLDTGEQKDRVLAAAKRSSARDYAILCALYYQGLRREECATLRWDGIDGRSVRGVGKGGYEYELPLDLRFVDAIRALEPAPGNPYVFPGRWPGTHISPNTVWMSVRLAGAAAGLGRVTPHQLRHTSIAVVLDTTGNARTAAEFARHRDLSTIHIYTRTAREQLLQGMSAL